MQYLIGAVIVIFGLGIAILGGTGHAPKAFQVFTGHAATTKVLK